MEEVMEWINEGVEDAETVLFPVNSKESSR
jgi:hypothetical protein